MSKQTLYGNFEVYGPDNQLMFRCHLDKINWYVKRGLAQIIKLDPLAIRLNFTPKGKGEPEAILKIERKNICACCGCNKIDTLTKHHLVPMKYRTHFPPELKNHASIFVMGLCEDCHQKYERTHALTLHKQLEDNYSEGDLATDFRTFRKMLCSLVSQLGLINRGEELPDDRFIEAIIEMSKRTQIYLNRFAIRQNTQENIDALNSHIDAISDKVGESKPVGKVIVDNFGDTILLSKIWVDNFFNNMQPKHVAEGLRESINETLRKRAFPKPT